MSTRQSELQRQCEALDVNVTELTAYANHAVRYKKMSAAERKRLRFYRDQLKSATEKLIARFAAADDMIAPTAPMLANTMVVAAFNIGGRAVDNPTRRDARKRKTSPATQERTKRKETVEGWIADMLPSFRQRHPNAKPYQLAHYIKPLLDKKLRARKRKPRTIEDIRQKIEVLLTIRT